MAGREQPAEGGGDGGGERDGKGVRREDCGAENRERRNDKGRFKTRFGDSART